jgi:hypothetical protein
MRTPLERIKLQMGFERARTMTPGDFLAHPGVNFRRYSLPEFGWDDASTGALEQPSTALFPKLTNLAAALQYRYATVKLIERLCQGSIASGTDELHKKTERCFRAPRGDASAPEDLSNLLSAYRGIARRRSA